MAYLPNEVFTSSFSVQNVSGSQFMFFRIPSNYFARMKRHGGSIGEGMVEMGFQIDSTIIPDLTSSLSSSLAAGTGSFSFG